MNNISAQKQCYSMNFYSSHTSLSLVLIEPPTNLIISSWHSLDVSSSLYYIDPFVELKRLRGMWLHHTCQNCQGKQFEEKYNNTSTQRFRYSTDESLNLPGKLPEWSLTSSRVPRDEAKSHSPWLCADGRHMAWLGFNLYPATALQSEFSTLSVL